MLPFLPEDSPYKQLIVDAQAAAAANNWLASIKTLQQADSLIFSALVRAAGFAKISAAVDSWETDPSMHLGCIDVLAQKEFKPDLIQMLNRDTLMDVKARLHGDERGSTGQFLSYLILDPSVGTRFSVAHPFSHGKSLELNEPGCLYVHPEKEGRRLSVARLDYRRDRSWCYFALARA